MRVQQLSLALLLLLSLSQRTVAWQGTLRRRVFAYTDVECVNPPILNSTRNLTIERAVNDSSCLCSAGPLFHADTADLASDTTSVMTCFACASSRTSTKFTQIHMFDCHVREGSESNAVPSNPYAMSPER